MKIKNKLTLWKAVVFLVLFFSTHLLALIAFAETPMSLEAIRELKPHLLEDSVDPEIALLFARAFGIDGNQLSGQLPILRPDGRLRVFDFNFDDNNQAHITMRETSAPISYWDRLFLPRDAYLRIEDILNPNRPYRLFDADPLKKEVDLEAMDFSEEFQNQLSYVRQNRNQFKVAVSNNRLVYAVSGKPVRTDNQNFIFVMDKFGDMFTHSRDWGSPRSYLTHSALALGHEGVAAAGMIGTTTRGRLDWISNHTGHFKLAPWSVFQLEMSLIKKGLQPFSQSGVTINPIDFRAIMNPDNINISPDSRETFNLSSD